MMGRKFVNGVEGGSVSVDDRGIDTLPSIKTQDTAH